MKILHKASGGNIHQRNLDIHECTALEIRNANSKI